MAVCLVLLAGCGTYDGTREAPRAPDVRTAPAAAPAAVPVAPPATPSAPPAQFPRSGGYYLDDGPGDNPPPNLQAVPDAVPRVEPLHKGALRPYTVMGRNYVPMTAVEPYRARGVASWYGRRYHGKLTSTGETYDMYGMSAAHPTLPLPSYVRVTSAANGKSVIVRVNDRGPFIDSRLIDLSYTAAYKLGVLAGGSALVDVEMIVPGVQVASARAPSPAPVPAVVAEAPAAVRQIPVANESSGVHLQLAAFGTKDNAEAYATRLRGDLAWLASQLQVYVRGGLFRVLAGPFANPGEARQTADKISQSLGVKPFVLVK
jgi:rare lipoprotein A